MNGEWCGLLSFYKTQCYNQILIFTQVIRRTWAQEATANQMRVIFVLGRPRGESPTEQAKLKAEADKYNDIMQFGFEVQFFLKILIISNLHLYMFYHQTL